jgi:nicotinamide-nucleotide amidase
VTLRLPRVLISTPGGYRRFFVWLARVSRMQQVFMNRNKKVRLFIDVLRERGLTLALAESMTCGLAAHQLSTKKGTSEVLKGSVVCYTEEMKCRALGISKSLIEKYSAESAQVTKALAESIRRLVSADIYAAVTGLAAAGGSETNSKPVGTVFFAVKYRGRMRVLRRRYIDTPLGVRQRAVIGLYDFILKVIQ